MKVYIYQDDTTGVEAFTCESHKNICAISENNTRVWLNDSRIGNFELSEIVTTRYSWSLGDFRTLVDNLYYMEGLPYSQVFKQSPKTLF